MRDNSLIFLFYKGRDDKMIAGIILSAVALTWIIVEGIENYHDCDYNCSRCS